MAETPTILYFGNDWSAENRTSSHHVSRWLASRFRVVYVECPGLRAPKGTGRDLRKLVAKLGLALAGPRPQPEGLSVQTLLQIPLHRFGLVRRANRLLVRASLKLLLARLGVRHPIAWFHVPHLASVVGRLGERLSIFYCIDDYASLPDVDPVAVRAMDEEMTRRVDLVFVASETLLERKRRLNPETYVSPHGVDYAHFARAGDPALSVPDDVAALPGPIVGYFGLIESRVDLGLVAWLADQRPSWTFLMIGRLAVSESETPRRPNLVYLGRRPYETLPAYGKAFTVSIIPYVLNEMNLHANPIKLREYLAMGKPIVSVSTPEIDRFAAHVRIGRSREELLAHLDAAVEKGLTPAEAEAQSALARTMTWDATLHRVVERIEARLGAPLGSAPAGAPEPAAAGGVSSRAHGPRG